jgi:hypothetical protein
MSERQPRATLEVASAAPLSIAALSIAEAAAAIASGPAQASFLLEAVLSGQLLLEAPLPGATERPSSVQESLRQFCQAARSAFDERLNQLLVAQGLAGAVPGAHFSGSLTDLAVADLTQILQLSGKSAVISIRRDGSLSQLWCCAGQIIDAESEGLRGEAAVYSILGFEHGTLVADLHAEPRLRTVHASTQSLILEAARRKDESALYRQKLGDLQRVYRLGAQALEERALDETTQRSPEELALLRSFEAPRSLAEALTASGLAELEALAALARWVEAGYLIETGARVPPSFSAQASAPADATASEAAPPTRESARPFTISVAPPEPETWRRGAAQWIWAALAAITMTIPAAYVLGTRAAQVPGAAVQTAAAAPAGPARQAAPASYLLDMQIEPAEAELQLDGSTPVPGHLRVSLERNGAAHELRASAPGYIPARIVFADVAPLTMLRLEPLPSPPGACADTASHHGNPPSLPTTLAPRVATESAEHTPPAAPEHTDESNPRSARPRPRPRTSKSSVPKAPRVQVIATQPVVRVID